MLPAYPSEDTTTLATVGGYVLKGRCTAPHPSTTNVELIIERTAGGSGPTVYQAGAFSSAPNGSDIQSYLRQTPVDGATVLAKPQTSTDANGPNIGRDAGTAMIRDGAAILQVSYHLVIDRVQPTMNPRCTISGSVIPTT